MKGSNPDYYWKEQTPNQNVRSEQWITDKYSLGIIWGLVRNLVCLQPCRLHLWHLFVPQEMEKEIKNVFRNGNQDEVLSEAFRLTITRKDIQTLNHLNWLNDEVISHLFLYSNSK